MEFSNEAISRILSRQLMGLPLGNISNIKRGEKNEKRGYIFKRD